MDYDINFEKIKKKLENSGAKKVLLQLPDGLKNDYAVFEEKLKGCYELFFWLGTCFGSCDIPTFVKSLGIDAIVHFGHFKFKKGETRL